MILSEAWKIYEQAKTVDGYADSTMEAYTLQIRLLIEFVGDIEADLVNVEMLRNYVGTLGKLKPASRDHRIRFMHSFFRFLFDEEYINRDPSRKIKEKGMQTRVPKALNIDQLENLREHCVSSRERSLLEMFFATGARLAELANIKISQLDWDRRTVTVLGKGNKEREVFWGAKADYYIRKYIGERSDGLDALFITQRKPYRAMSKHALYGEIKRIAKRAGIDKIVWPHVLRHTLATVLLNNGADLATVQSVLGHSKPETTMIYATVSGARRKQLFDRYFPQ